MCSLQRLQAKVLKLVDISYGGENGFNQAIELSAEVLSNVKFIQEKKLIGDSSFRTIEMIFNSFWNHYDQTQAPHVMEMFSFSYRAIL